MISKNLLFLASLTFTIATFAMEKTKNTLTKSQKRNHSVSTGSPQKMMPPVKKSTELKIKIFSNYLDNTYHKNVQDEFKHILEIIDKNTTNELTLDVKPLEGLVWKQQYADLERENKILTKKQNNINKRQKELENKENALEKFSNLLTKESDELNKKEKDHNNFMEKEQLIKTQTEEALKSFNTQKEALTKQKNKLKEESQKTYWNRNPGSTFGSGFLTGTFVTCFVGFIAYYRLNLWAR